MEKEMGKEKNINKNSKIEFEIKDGKGLIKDYDDDDKLKY